MIDCFVTNSETPTIPIQPLTEAQFPAWLAAQDALTVNWVQRVNFTALPDRICLIPDARGDLKTVILGVTDVNYFWHFGGLPKYLGSGVYELDRHAFKTEDQYQRALLAFGLGAYQFNTYRQQAPYQAKIFVTQTLQASLQTLVSSIYLVRDWINTPTEEMGPPELSARVHDIAKTFNATINDIVGDDLLKKGFRAIHAVGRAGSRAPRLIDLRWGEPNAPKVTLVGKGVCFDSGGLDLKPSSAMALMKKDMGGAANALGLARLIMQRELPVRLRLLIPAVENAVGSLSYRPGDVIRMKSGLSVEVTNTDAEGRLVVADALSEAVTENPETLFDFATLTGDARRALGPSLPAFFCNQEHFAEDLLKSAEKVMDPIWRLPLYVPYNDYLKSDIADLVNSSRVPMAGAITAALFLKRFVPDQIPWAHFDLYAWNMENLPGRPIGGEAMVLRGVLQYLENKFAMR